MIAVDAVSIQGLDGLVCFGVAGHLNKAISLGPAGEPVLDHFNAFDGSEFGKQIFYGIFRGAER